MSANAATIAETLLIVEALSIVKVSTRVRCAAKVLSITRIVGFVPTLAFVCMTIPEEIDEHDDINICYEWHPWDPNDSGYKNVYIRVVHQNHDGGLLTSVEFNHAHVILKKHRFSNRYGYPRQHTIRDPGVVNFLRKSNFWVARICNVPNFN